MRQKEKREEPFGGEPLRRCEHCGGRLLRDLTGEWFCPSNCGEASDDSATNGAAGTGRVSMASETEATKPRAATAGCPCGHESLFHAGGGAGGCFVPRCACVAFGQGEPAPEASAAGADADDESGPPETCRCGHEWLYHTTGGLGPCFARGCTCTVFDQAESTAAPTGEPEPARSRAVAPLPPKPPKPRAPETATAAEIRAAAREIGRKLWRIPGYGPYVGEARAYAAGSDSIRFVRRNYELSPLAKLIVEALLDEIG